MLKFFKYSSKAVIPCITKGLPQQLPKSTFSNFNSPLSEEDSWKLFPIVPFFNGNVKLGLFLGIPGILSFIVPGQIAFDYIGLALAAYALPMDYKHYKDPYSEFNYLGLKVNPKVIMGVSVLNSICFTVGVLGEFYMLSSVFTALCYLGVMGGYRNLSDFLNPKNLTIGRIRLAGALISTLGAGLLTDLHMMLPNMVLDPTRFMIPIYFLGTYIASGPIMNIYKEASKKLALDPELGNVDYHMSRLLVLFKWANFIAFAVFLGVLNYSKAPGSS